ncbi:MAG: LysR family transcriptional regulator [Betaproteobacteria bacterium RIFCSPLOWO2_02_FULL_65_24]|nr:MAG: LysR family transcriptional regulator [Betaproteobacteria bacterium RIFCSPLOWO2_02_FULL_65_24]OGA35119.1 MAG: LysR family transcriptional regulator [Betaproteobacteria bacterium RIFCSPLOWO2_12_FULL_62_13b]
MELKDVDLNLLVTFQQLFQERRVSAAAASLGLSQPAVSNALKRLRLLLGDELFVRSSRGMIPTPFAERLAGPTAQVLDTVYHLLNRQTSFEAQTSTRNFTVALADIGEVHFLPPLMEVLGRTAPRVTIGTVPNTAPTLREDMAAGKVDLAVGSLLGLKADFFQRRLFRERYVCMFRPGHPLDKAKVSAAEFAAAEHVVVMAPGTGHQKMNEILDRAGARGKIALRVPRLVAVADIVCTRDLLATVPEEFAQRGAAFFGLKYVAHPMKLPEIEINLYWHASYHRDAANQWLRALFIETFAV